MGPCQGTVTDLLEGGRHARQSFSPLRIHCQHKFSFDRGILDAVEAARKDPNQAWDDTTLKTPRSACPGGLDLSFVLLLDSRPPASLSFR